MGNTNIHPSKQATSSKKRTSKPLSPSKRRSYSSPSLPTRLSPSKVSWSGVDYYSAFPNIRHSPSTSHKNPLHSKPVKSAKRSVTTHTYNLFDFSDALRYLKRGLKVSRIAWLANSDSSASDIFLSMPLVSSQKAFTDAFAEYYPYPLSSSQNQSHSPKDDQTALSPSASPSPSLPISVQPYLALHRHSKITLGYTPSSQDLFAEDYFIA